MQQLAIVTAMITMVVIVPVALAESSANVLPLGPSSNYGDQIAGDPGGSTAIESLTNLIGGFTSTSSGLLGKVRLLIGVIAIGMIIVSAVRLLFAQGDEGQIGNAKKGLLLGLVGLAVISLAGEVSKILSVNNDTTAYIYQNDSSGIYCNFASTFLGDGNAVKRELACRIDLFNGLVKMLITLTKYVIGSIAVFQVIKSAYRMVTLGGESSSLDQDKKSLLFGGLGLMVIIFSESIISKVFYKINFKTTPGLDGVTPKIDPNEAVRQIVAFTNIAVSIIGPVLIAILIGAAIMYMTSGGNEDKQKQATRAIFAAAVGMLVVYGAFGIVSTVIAGRFE